MNELEFESLTLIKEKDYLSLLDKYSKLYPNHHITDQINVYFDDDKLSLYHINEVLRLRIYKDHRPSKFTYKFDRKNGGGAEEIFQKLAEEEELNLLEKNIIPEGPVKEALKIKGIKSIQFVGKIRTYRFEVFHKEYTIVLDENEYENIVDYNLEIESDSEAKSIEIMKAILKESNIKLEIDRTTKSKRAINAHLNKK